MKTQNKNTAVNIEKTVIESMYQETKETIATNMTTANNKSFSSAELWNIQRNMRTRTGRRYFI
ncbi:MAG: hypothetical protein WCH78_10650 [Bacteroidota bacterium]|jgi:hypothetical protein